MEVVGQQKLIETEIERKIKIETEIGMEKKVTDSLGTGLFCPLCNVFAGRRIRNKLYCGNCGFVES